MSIRKVPFLFFTFLFLSICVKAQYDLTLYNMRSVPQSMYDNPAYDLEAKVNIGLPVISSLYFHVAHTGFKYKHLVNLAGDSLRLNGDLAISKMAENNLVTLSQRTDLLSVGFAIKENYISFGVTEKVDFRFGYPRDFFSLIWNGNDQFLGQQANFGNLAFDMTARMEYWGGFSRSLLDDRLNVGGRIKLMQGFANIHTPRQDVNLYTNDTTFAWTVNADYQVNFGGLPFLSVTEGLRELVDSNYTATDSLANYDAGDMFGQKNFGAGIDLGATFQIDDMFSVQASVSDLGFIGWKTNPANFTLDNASFTFEGIDALAILTDSAFSADSLTNELLDSVVQAFEVDHTSNNYTTGTMPRVIIGGNVTLAEKHTFGLLLHGEFFKKKVRPGFTASYNLHVGKALSLALSYSYYNRSWSNLGFGFSVGRYVQWYLVTDNLTGLLTPQSSKNVHIHTGLNIRAGFPSKDRDEDGILDKDDHCPDDPGPEELNGCPDTDGDKIVDKDDACPEVAGVPEFSGCPDTDSDGITDTLDNCPQEAGPKDLGGCPDRDDDKIIDKEDDCPDEAGPAATQGCPDKDGDTVIDKDDLCPEKPGPVDHQGCPDSDGDGLYDNDDKCPDTFGPESNFGCPYGDLDGDGVFDKDDRCVDTPGPVENQGCPYGDLDGDSITDNIDECPNTPGTKENNGCPEIHEEHIEIIQTAFDNLEFESGKAIIRASSYTSLDTLAKMLVDHEHYRLRIEGHTDNVGSAASNLTLSKKRAQAVMDYLNLRGINDDSRFEVEGYGETRPLYPNNTAEGRQKNRRVHMEIIFD